MRPLAAVSGTLFCLMTTASPAAAVQWRIGLDMTATRYAGSTRAVADTGVRLAPAPSLLGSVRIERLARRWAAALRIGYAKTGIRGFREPVSVTDQSVGELVEAGILVGFQVGGIGPSGAVKVELGPALLLWDSGDGQFDSRLAAAGALAYEWTLAGKLSGAIRLEGLLSPSWFEAGELPAELERVSTRRYGVSLGLRYRL